MLVLPFILSVLCSKIEKNNIGNKYFYIEYLPEPELKLVKDGANMILKKVSEPKLKTDPGAIYLEELEFNVFLFKLDDGYVCKNANYPNMALNVCKTPKEKYTEWAMIKLNEYLQIRTRERGLCLEKSAPINGSTTEYSMKVGPCKITTPFQFGIREIESLNVEEEREEPSTDSEKVRNVLNRIKYTTSYNPLTESSISRQYSNAIYPSPYYNSSVYPYNYVHTHRPYNYYSKYYV